jgi:hypothetical protein
MIGEKQMLTLTDYMRPLRRYIPTEVISHEAFERMLALTTYFPATMANGIFDFEIYLQEDRTDLDLHFRATNESRQQLSLVSTYDHPIWQKVARFSALWDEPTSLLHQDTDDIWLAFDLDQPASAISSMPIPSIFYCSVRERRADPSPIIRLLAGIFRTSAEVALLTYNLARCLRQMPAQAQINEVGFGLLRAREAVRLQILQLSPREIPAYLNSIGWNYPVEPLLPVLDRLAVSDMLSLVIDVSTHIHPKIGLECFMNTYDWQTLLDFLVEQGLCQSAKRNFLVNRPWVKLCQMGQQVSLTRQGLSHIKVGYHPEQTSAPFEAKSYLSYYPGWSSPIANDTDEEMMSNIVV